MSHIDKDKLIMDELRAKHIDGLTVRGRIAIRKLAESNEGAVIFLILSLNARIRELENIIMCSSNGQKIH